jgi:tRNA-dihydrouridine synthase C
VSQEVISKRTLRAFVPELDHGSQTRSGTPVQVQLLGGNPELMAESALVACELGSPGVDLNFGCPAPTVNRHDGGATLLKYPDRIRGIVEAVRRAVPRHLAVSAKLRLGWDDPDQIFVNASRAVEGGASWITVHARTRMAGYQPPVFWEKIGQLRRVLESDRGGVPVVANGDIWSWQDFLKCRELSGAHHFMMGRGALCDPGLVLRIASELGLGHPGDSQVTQLKDDGSCPVTHLELSHWAPILLEFIEISRQEWRDPGLPDAVILARCKQWVRMAKTHRGLLWFDEIKKMKTLGELEVLLAQVV